MVNTRSKTKKKMKQVDYSNQHSTQSAAFIASNEDLLTEILIRLPVTSILRFKSVSKHWRLLLSHKHFTNRYDNNNNNLSKSPGVFVFNIYVPFDVEDQRTPPFRNLDLFFKRPNVRVMQSCNGLLLCCSNYYGGTGSHEYFVFNPTTKQVAIVPSVTGGQRVRRTICLMALAFHPNDCAHYKLVCVRALKHGDALFQIQVYSSETCKWKISVESFYAHEPIFRNPVYWNGAVYWTPFYSSYLYFKLDVEQLQTLPLHEGLVPSKIPTMCFRESRGHLHLIVNNNRGYNSFCFNVYEMMSDHLGWFVKYQVQFDGLPYAFLVVISQYWYNFRVVDVVRGEKEEDTFLVLVFPGKMVTYNIHDKSFTEIYSRVGYNFEQFSNVHLYNETLTSF